MWLVAGPGRRRGLSPRLTLATEVLEHVQAFDAITLLVEGDKTESTPAAAFTNACQKHGNLEYDLQDSPSHLGNTPRATVLTSQLMK